MSKRKVITIDGLAGSGKTTIARTLAQKLGYTFFYSGGIYRIVGYLALKNNLDLNNGALIAKALAESKIDVVAEGANNRQFLNAEDISGKIYTPECSEATSKSAAHPEVRAMLLKMQRSALPDKNIIAEGRDMGTVVFPDADLKFFITCTPESLIARRFKQQNKPGKILTEEESNVLKSKMKIEIVERNERDLKRKDSPTIPAKDALVVDNSSEELTNTIDYLYSLAVKKLQ